MIIQEKQKEKHYHENHGGDSLRYLCLYLSISIYILYSTTFQREISHALLHYIYLTALVSFKLKIAPDE